MSFSAGLGLIYDPIIKKITDDPGAITSNTATPMAISAVSVSGIGGGSATITWTTTVGSSSKVSYGVSPNRDNVSPETNAYPNAQVTSHSVTLTGLVAGKVYLFRVHSRMLGGTDGQYNQVMDGYQFTADGSFVAA